MRRGPLAPLSARLTLAIGLLVVLLVAPAVYVAVAAPPTTPAGYPRSQALYLPMRDGVRIAVDVWLPQDLAAGGQVPTVLRVTRYWRSRAGSTAPRNPWLTAAGYALVEMDARGSGASFGVRPVEWSDDEVADYGEVIDWIARQPWSNGRVGAYGISYEGNTAELTAAPNRPALRATSPQYGNFDPLLSVARPGGVFNQRFLHDWNAGNQALDHAADLMGAVGIPRGRSPKPVDADPEAVLLRQAVAAHDSIDVYDTIRRAVFADDRMGQYSIRDISPAAGRRAAISRSGVPMFVWVGWFDAATADGAICRYLTFPNPQRVMIGAFSHGGAWDTDPFLPEKAPVNPSLNRQRQLITAFFDRHLKGDAKGERAIDYYTMGEGQWHTTTTWPPAGLTRRAWYLGPQHTLTTTRPAGGGADTYRVDFTATTSTRENNRWFTPGSGGDVVYPDRREEDRKLLTYTSAPLAVDTEITGTAVVSLSLASTHRDGAVYAYLEDVAPDGRVTYLTEGMLRLIHRKVSAEKPPYPQLGPYHSFLRRDVAAMVPGRREEVTWGLFVTSALVRRGHCLRLALAGHDASVFARYPGAGDPVLTVYHGSKVLVPMRERRSPGG